MHIVKGILPKASVLVSIYIESKMYALKTIITNPRVRYHVIMISGFVYQISTAYITAFSAE